MRMLELLGSSTTKSAHSTAPGARSYSRAKRPPGSPDTISAMRRRDFLPSLAAAGSVAAAAQESSAPVQRKGRLKQCVTRGVFGRGMDFDETCKQAARLGCKGYDLIGPKDWPTLKKYGLIPTMYPPGPGGTIPDGLNRKENHERI